MQKTNVVQVNISVCSLAIYLAMGNSKHHGLNGAKNSFGLNALKLKLQGLYLSRRCATDAERVPEHWFFCVLHSLKSNDKEMK